MEANCNLEERLFCKGGMINTIGEKRANIDFSKIIVDSIVKQLKDEEVKTKNKIQMDKLIL
jgi:hypothetical protein